MSQTPSPALSPAFERARKLSVFMLGVFTFAFWMTLALLVAIPVMVAIPGANGSLDLGYAIVSFAKLSGLQRIGAGLALAIGAIPVLLLMHHARRLFRHFARGEVFTATAIGHIRAAGVWLIVSFFAAIAGRIVLALSGVPQTSQNDAGLWPLITGITTFIAAHVMTEAARIAAENAEIV